MRFGHVMLLGALGGAPGNDGRAVENHRLEAAWETQDPKLVKALEAWLKTYRQGRLDVAGKADVGRESIARKYGVLPKGTLGRLTHLREAEILLGELVDTGGTEAAVLCLRFASIGLDDGKYGPRMVPDLVRALGERAVAKLTGEAARDRIVQVARDGYRKGGRDRSAAVQGAALRAIAGFAGTAHLSLLESGLANDRPAVRAGAADALAALAFAGSSPALARALADEQDERAIRSIVGALAAILAAHPQDADARAAAVAAAAVLGRSTWRADLAIVELLDRSRGKEAIPALISVLRRFVDEPELVEEGRLSGLLRKRAHEALVALTGARMDMHDPEAWQQWWNDNGPGFEVPQTPASDASADHTTAGFFGIPVEGTRVVFVIDLSLSMVEPMGAYDPDRADRPSTRLEVAREEVWKAVQRLDEHAQFNVIVFSEDARAWSKKLVRPTPSHKKSLRRFLDRLDGEPYTNLWSGIAAALNLEDNAYSQKESLDLDVIYLLSDGAPTIGEITDMPEILRTVTELNRSLEIRINTVFIEGKASIRDPVTLEGEMGPAELMKALAEQNGGTFVKK